jgi:endonuclease YncB( thermonuclease family)
VPWADARAETLTARVIGITDGDTITVLIDHRQVKVRLADIDAPESKQAFGSRSKQALSDLCFQKNAKLETAGKDRYGRTIATVYCAGRNANAEQVRQGMAWVFDRYAKPDSPLYFIQKQAKEARRGLWSDSNPVPPWEWQREHRRAGYGRSPPNVCSIEELGGVSGCESWDFLRPPSSRLGIA